FFFFSSRRRHTSFSRDWSSDVCSSDLGQKAIEDAMKMAHEHSDNKGYARYQQPTILATLDPTAQVSKETLELKSLPDGYNPEVRSEERRVGKARRSR